MMMMKTDSDDAPDGNEEMTDEEEVDLVDDESHNALTAGRHAHSHPCNGPPGHS